MHKGRISVSSVEGEYTEFVVSINAILTAMQELKGNEIHELNMFI